jgi:hypothetical protein
MTNELPQGVARLPKALRLTGATLVLAASAACHGQTLSPSPSASPSATPTPSLATAAATTPAPGADSASLQNWFNDPFFQFTAAVANCPVPLGPLIRADERAAQAHRRAEKGTSCWLAGSCERPNAYAYDADIAAQLKAALAQNQLYTHSPLVNSSLWATVQGRVVTIDGCMAGDAYTSFNADAIHLHIANVAKSIPNVLQAVVRVRTSGGATAQTHATAAVPYPVRP